MNLLTVTRSELAKQFTTASWWVLLVVLAGYIGVTAAGLAFMVGAVSSGLLSESEAGLGDLPGIAALVYSVGSSVGYVFPLLIGTLLVTGEFRHRTLTPTFLTVPRRGLVLGGKVLTGVVLGILYGVVAVVVAAGPAAGLFAVFGVDTELGDPDTWTMFGRMIIAFVAWAVIGVGLGLVVRNQVAAIVIVLAFTQFVEPLLRVGGGFVDALGEITRWLPGSASDALVGQSLYAAMGAATTAPVEWWAGGLALFGCAAVLLVVGHLVSWRRDVT